MLISFSGLPGTGKTSIAREVARQLGATHVRIDSIEQALLSTGPASFRPMDDSGYRVAYALAQDNLLLGNTVIADSVNPLAVTRNAWRSVATRVSVAFLDVEVVCTDSEEHQRRIETRVTDIPGLKLPTWDEVQDREYEPWSSPRLVVDTAKLSLAQGAALIIGAL